MPDVSVGSVSIDIVARLKNYREVLAQMKKDLEKVDIISNTGRQLESLIGIFEKKVNKLELDPFKKINSSAGLRQYVNTIESIAQLMNEIGTTFNNIGAGDLNISALGDDFENSVKQIKQYNEQLDKLSTSGFSDAIKQSQDLSDHFASIGVNIDNLSQAQGLKILAEETRKAASAANAARAEFDKLEQQYQSQSESKTRLEKSFFSDDTKVRSYINNLKTGRTDISKVQKNTNYFNELESTWLNNIEDYIGRNSDKQVYGPSWETEIKHFLNTVDPQNFEAGYTILFDSLARRFPLFGKGDIKKVFNYDKSLLTQRNTSQDSRTSDYIRNLASELNLDQTINKTTASDIGKALGFLDEDKVNEAVSLAIKILEKGQKDYQKALIDINEKLTTTTGQQVGAQNKVNTTQTNLDTAKTREAEYNAIVNKYQQEVDQLKQDIKKLQDQLEEAIKGKLKEKTGNQYLKKSQDDLNKLSAEYQSLSHQLDILNEKSQSLGNIQHFIQRWFSLYSVIRMVRQAINSVKTTLKDLDKTITEIAIVTDMSQKDLWSQMPQYTKIAQQFGTSISGVYKVSQLYYQQGLQQNDVMKLTNESLKMARISGLDYATTTNYMTNAIRSFKMEMSDAQRVVDVYSAIAASSATNTSELAVAMSKTAASAEAVGSDFESTTAMLAVMIESTREAPENLGSAMKSIISRYGELKSDPSILIDSEGEEISLNKVDTALKSVGITLQDTNHQFRSFSDVIMELSQKWDTIDTNTQRYIATVMAGNRQQSRFLSLVSNYARLTELNTIALDAEDEAQLQVLKTMDSIEVKSQQMSTALQTLYVESGIQNFYKYILDVGTEIITQFTAMPTIFNLPIQAITVFGMQFINLARLVKAAFVMIRVSIDQAIAERKAKQTELLEQEKNGEAQTAQQKKNIWQDLRLAYRNHLSEMQKDEERYRLGQKLSAIGQTTNGFLFGSQTGRIAGSMTSLGLSILGTRLKASDNKGAQAGGALAGIGSSALSGAMLGSGGGPVGIAVGAVAGGLIGLVSEWNTIAGIFKTDLDEIRKKATEANNSFLQKKNEAKTLEKEIVTLEKLAETQYDSNEAKQQFIDQNNSIVNSYPNLIQAYDDEGNAIASTTKAYEALKKARKETIKSGEEAAKNSYDLIKDQIKEAKETLDEAMIVSLDYIDEDLPNSFYDAEERLDSLINEVTKGEFQTYGAISQNGIFRKDWTDVSNILSEQYQVSNDKLNEILLTYIATQEAGSKYGQYEKFIEITGATSNPIIENFINTFFGEDPSGDLLSFLEPNNFNNLNKAFEDIGFPIQTFLTEDVLNAAQAYYEVLESLRNEEESSIKRQTALKLDLLEKNDPYLKQLEGTYEWIEEYVYEQYQKAKNENPNLKYEDFLSDNIDQLINNFIDSNGELLQSLLDDSSAEYNELIAQKSNYSRRQMQDKLREYLPDLDIDSLLNYLYNEDVFQYTDFIKALGTEEYTTNKLNYNNTELAAWHFGGEQELTNYLSWVKTINKQVEEGTLTSIQAQAILDQYANLIISIPEESEDLVQKLFESWDGSLSGLSDIEAELEDQGIFDKNPKWQAQFNALKKVLPININTETESLFANYKKGFEDYDKVVKKLDKGMDFSDAQALAAKLDVDLTKFQFNASTGLYTYNDYAAVQEAYFKSLNNELDNYKLIFEKLSNGVQIDASLLDYANNLKNISLDTAGFGFRAKNIQKQLGLEDNDAAFRQIIKAFQDSDFTDFNEFLLNYSDQISVLTVEMQSYIARSYLSIGDLEGFIKSVLGENAPVDEYKKQILNGDYTDLESYKEAIIELLDNIRLNLIDTAIENIKYTGIDEKGKATYDVEEIKVDSENYAYVEKILNDLGRLPEDLKIGDYVKLFENLEEVEKYITEHYQDLHYTIEEANEKLSNIHEKKYQHTIDAAVEQIASSYDEFDRAAADDLALASGKLVEELVTEGIIKLNELTGKYYFESYQDFIDYVEKNSANISTSTYNAVLANAVKNRQEKSTINALLDIADNYDNFSIELLEKYADSKDVLIESLGLSADAYGDYSIASDRLLEAARREYDAGRATSAQYNEIVNKINERKKDISVNAALENIASTYDDIESQYITALADSLNISVDQLRINYGITAKANGNYSMAFESFEELLNEYVTDAEEYNTRLNEFKQRRQERSIGANIFAIASSWNKFTGEQASSLATSLGMTTDQMKTTFGITEDVEGYYHATAEIITQIAGILLGTGQITYETYNSILTEVANAAAEISINDALTSVVSSFDKISADSMQKVADALHMDVNVLASMFGIQYDAVHGIYTATKESATSLLNYVDAQEDLITAEDYDQIYGELLSHASSISVETALTNIASTYDNFSYEYANSLAKAMGTDIPALLASGELATDGFGHYWTTLDQFNKWVNEFYTQQAISVQGYNDIAIATWKKQQDAIKVLSDITSSYDKISPEDMLSLAQQYGFDSIDDFITQIVKITGQGIQETVEGYYKLTADQMYAINRSQLHNGTISLETYRENEANINKVLGKNAIEDSVDKMMSGYESVATDTVKSIADALGYFSLEGFANTYGGVFDKITDSYIFGVEQLGALLDDLFGNNLIDSKIYNTEKAKLEQHKYEYSPLSIIPKLADNYEEISEDLYVELLNKTHYSPEMLNKIYGFERNGRNWKADPSKLLDYLYDEYKFGLLSLQEYNDYAVNIMNQQNQKNKGVILSEIAGTYDSITVDQLSSIATAFGTSVNQIKELFNLTADSFGNYSLTIDQMYDLLERSDIVKDSEQYNTIVASIEKRAKELSIDTALSNIAGSYDNFSTEVKNALVKAVGEKNLDGLVQKGIDSWGLTLDAYIALLDTQFAAAEITAEAYNEYRTQAENYYQNKSVVSSFKELTSSWNKITLDQAEKFATSLGMTVNELEPMFGFTRDAEGNYQASFDAIQQIASLLYDSGRITLDTYTELLSEARSVYDNIANITSSYGAMSVDEVNSIATALGKDLSQFMSEFGVSFDAVAGVYRTNEVGAKAILNEAKDQGKITTKQYNDALVELKKYSTDNSLTTALENISSSFDRFTYEQATAWANAIDKSVDEMIASGIFKTDGHDNFSIELEKYFEYIDGLKDAGEISLKKYNEIYAAANQRAREISDYSIISEIINNRNALQENNLQALADQLSVTYEMVEGYFTKEADGTYSASMAEIENLIMAFNLEANSAIQEMLTEIFNEILSSLTGLAGAQSGGFTSTADMQAYVKDINKQLKTNYLMQDIFTWSENLHAFVFNTTGLVAEIDSIFNQIMYMSEDEQWAAQKLINDTKRQFAEAIDIFAYIESTGAEKDKAEIALRQAINDYDHVVSQTGGNLLFVNQIIKALNVGGEAAVKAGEAVAAAQGRTLSADEVTSLYRSAVQDYNDLFTALFEARIGNIITITDSMRQALSESSSFNDTFKQIGDSNQYIVTSIESIVEVFRDLYNSLKNTVGVTLTELNETYQQVLELESDQSLINALSQAGSMSYSALGEIATQAGLTLEALYENLIKQNVITDIGGGNVRINNFDYFARVTGLDRDTTSEAYISAFKTYNDGLVELNHLTETRIKDEISSIQNAQPDSILNLSYLWQEMQQKLKPWEISGFNNELKFYGAAFSDGILHLSENANIAGVIQSITEMASTYGLILESDVAELADALRNVLNSLANAIQQGLAGTLGHVEAGQLQQTAKNLLGIDLTFTETTQGLKLSTDQATLLYSKLVQVDSISAQIVFESLQEQLTKTGEACEDVSSTMARIAQLEKEAAENSAGLTAEKQRQLDLYRKIASTQMDNPDSYKFMDKNLPNSMQGPVNYWNSIGKMFTTINEAKSNKNKMAVEDFYNIVNELNNLAALGSDIEVLGMNLDGSLESAAALIEKGMGALSNVDGKGVKVDLSKFGAAFFSGADAMGDNVEDGIHALAQSQIDMLDAMIKLLETVVAMEKLGKIDSETENGILEFGEIFEDLKDGFYISTDNAHDAAVEILNMASTDKELLEALQDVQIGGESVYDMMVKLKDRTKLTKEQADQYEAMLNAFYKMALSGDYTLDTIISSVQEMAKQSQFKGVIKVGETEVAMGYGLSIIKEGEYWKYNGKEYDNPDEVLAKMTFDSLQGFKDIGDLGVNDQGLWEGRATVSNTKFTVELQKDGTFKYKLGNDTYDTYTDAVKAAFLAEHKPLQGKEWNDFIGALFQEWLTGNKITIPAPTVEIDQAGFQSQTEEAFNQAKTTWLGLLRDKTYKITQEEADQLGKVGIKVDVGATINTMSHTSISSISELFGIKVLTEQIELTADMDPETRWLYELTRGDSSGEQVTIKHIINPKSKEEGELEDKPYEEAAIEYKTATETLNGSINSLNDTVIAAINYLSSKYGSSGEGIQFNKNYIEATKAFNSSATLGRLAQSMFYEFINTGTFGFDKNKKMNNGDDALAYWFGHGNDNPLTNSGLVFGTQLNSIDLGTLKSWLSLVGIEFKENLPSWYKEGMDLSAYQKEYSVDEFGTVVLDYIETAEQAAARAAQERGEKLTEKYRQEQEQENNDKQKEAADTQKEAADTQKTNAETYQTATDLFSEAVTIFSVAIDKIAEVAGVIVNYDTSSVGPLDNPPTDNELLKYYDEYINQGLYSGPNWDEVKGIPTYNNIDNVTKAIEEVTKTIPRRTLGDALGGIDLWGWNEFNESVTNSPIIQWLYNQRLGEIEDQPDIRSDAKDIKEQSEIEEDISNEINELTDTTRQIAEMMPEKTTLTEESSSIDWNKPTEPEVQQKQGFEFIPDEDFGLGNITSGLENASEQLQNSTDATAEAIVTTTEGIKTTGTAISDLDGQFTTMQDSMSTTGRRAYYGAGAISNLAANINKLPSNKIIDIMLKFTSTGVGLGTTGQTNAEIKLTAVGKGNVALAGGKKRTLMGELGPELVVSNGHYFVVGQNGAEFVDLDDDAIVFNHLQTKNLFKNGFSGRGVPVTNERNATSFATGNVGPAMASASEALAQLRQIRAMWESLLNASLREMGSLAGNGSGGGGGGGGKIDPGYIADLERWYNLLRQIAQLEKDINYEEKLRSKLSSDLNKNGREYYSSQVKSLENLKTQIKDERQLAELQKGYFERRVEDFENSPLSQIYHFDKDLGIMQLNDTIKMEDGTNGGLHALATVLKTKETGESEYTAKEQYEILKSWGFADYMTHDDSGKEIDINEDGGYSSAVQAFFDKIEGRIDELDSLWESYNDQIQAILDDEATINKLLQEIVDNQLSLEKQVLDAVENRSQKEIDELKKNRDALNDSQKAFIDGLSDQLSKERDMYDREQTATETNKLRRQLAILQRAGGSASEIASLQKQIQEADKDAYFDAQQAQIDAVQEASDKEIERLDAQLDIMTESLEYQKEHGLLWTEVYAVMAKSEEEILAFIQSNGKDWESKSALQTTMDLQGLKFSIEQYIARRDEVEGKNIDRIIDALNDTTISLSKDIEGFIGARKEEENIKKGSGGNSDSKSGGGGSGGGGSGGGSSGGGSGAKAKKTWKIEGINWLSFDTKEAAEEELRKLIEIAANNGAKDVARLYSKKSVYSYSEGGLANYTGLAMLHGTKTRPEWILNAEQTKALWDIMNTWKSDIMSGNKVARENSAIQTLRELRDTWTSLMAPAVDNINNNTSSSNIVIEHAEVNMNVNSIANDYDARRAGQQALSEMVKIARKNGTQAMYRR